MKREPTDQHTFQTQDIDIVAFFIADGLAVTAKKDVLNKVTFEVDFEDAQGVLKVIQDDVPAFSGLQLLKALKEVRRMMWSTIRGV